jgi:hypothetical protein
MQKVRMPIKVRHCDGSVDTAEDWFYLASEVDVRVAEYEDLLRRSGLALSGVAGPMSKLFIDKLLADMQAFTTRIFAERYSS